MKSKTFNTEKYSTLLKKATSLKKENISQAINFIKQALEAHKDHPQSFRREGIRKLADYERINGNPKETIVILYRAYKEAIYSDEYFMRAMEATIFISTIASQTKKMKIKGSGLEMASDKLHILALAVQGRMASASQRMPHILDNEELNEFLSINKNEFNFFNENSPLYDDKIWKTDKQINERFFGIVDEIDLDIKKAIESIEDILTT